MDAIINLLVVMTVLSVAAERVTNLFKLKNEKLRVASGDPAKDRAREYGITGRSLLCGVALAVLVKADFFAILNALEDPYKSLGWVRPEGYKWIRSPATATFGGFAYALLGCLVTGVGLGFGSKFWHDILGTVRSLRDLANKKAGGGG